VHIRAQVVSGIAVLLQRTMGPNIQVATELSATGEVKGDPSQLEQVVMNLAANARDAMPAGGHIALLLAPR
jgi:signal transduction histidine kinase